MRFIQSGTIIDRMLVWFGLTRFAAGLLVNRLGLWMFWLVLLLLVLAAFSFFSLGDRGGTCDIVEAVDGTRATRMISGIGQPIRSEEACA